MEVGVSEVPSKWVQYSEVVSREENTSHESDGFLPNNTLKHGLVIKDKAQKIFLYNYYKDDDIFMMQFERRKMQIIRNLYIWFMKVN